MSKIEFALLTTKETPPGGFEVTIQETGHTIRHYAWNAFMERVESHMVANNIPVSASFEDELQDRLCREHMPLWANHCKRVNAARPRKKPGFGALMTFINMARGWVGDTFSGSPLTVSQEEAERRAAICVTCPLNSKNIALGCGGCMGAFTKALTTLLGNKKTSQDFSLGSCGICGCSLKAAVHVPNPPQWNALTDSQKEDFLQLDYCWKRPE